MSKAYFAYIRVSTVRQGERGSSLAEQKNAIETYASRNALSITGWFEEMETAAKQGRRQFSQMLAALRVRKADGLIIHKIDRSARNLRDWSDLGDLIDRGIDVRFVSDNFDMLSRGGRLSADIQAVVAADYIRNLRDEVRKGLYGRLKQGIYPFRAPMGYLDTGMGKAKAIDPVKGPLVQRLFQRYATNAVNFEQLRKELAEMGLRSAAGLPLYPNSLTIILNNPFYMGVIRIRSTGETFQGAHEPLVSKALFDRVQLILLGKAVHQIRKHDFLLRKLVKCGECERRTLSGEHQKSYTYYRCHSGSCVVSWRQEKLEEIIIHQIHRVRFWEEGGDNALADNGSGLQDLRDLVADESRKLSADAETIAASLNLRLSHLDGRLSRLADLLLDAAIDLLTFNTRREQLLMERQGILNAIDAAKKEPPLERLFAEFERNNRKLLRYEMLTTDEKRELIEIVCSNFSVHGETPVFTLRSPYKEIAESGEFAECGPHRDRVRTLRLFEILKASAVSGRLPYSNVPDVPNIHGSQREINVSVSPAETAG